MYDKVEYDCDRPVVWWWRDVLATGIGYVLLCDHHQSAWLGEFPAEEFVRGAAIAPGIWRPA